MQDRFAGDIGDFAKLGLLRHLTAPLRPGGQGLRLGVVWWRVPDDEGNDGQHVHYLSERTTHAKELCACDRPLADALRSLVDSGERSIAALQQCPIWPEGARFFAETLDCKALPVARRESHRASWLGHAVAAIRDCDLVFVDPDNGLEIASCSRRAALAGKYVFYDELARLSEGTRSLIVYQHADRSKDQIARRREELRAALGLPELPLALTFRRTSCRTFFVIPGPKHRDHVHARIEAFLASRWHQHFALAE